MSTYYRGESKNFGNTSCVPSILRVINKSSTLIESERKYYKSVEKIMNEHATIRQISEKNEEMKLFYQLTVFQHYGFATRLLDITPNSNIATYFACCSNFDDDGFVFQFSDEKEYFTLDIEHIKRKMKVIINAEKDISDKASILGDNGKDSTVSANVIIDISKLESTFENLRQQRQKGKFVLFGNKIEHKQIQDEFQLVQRTIFKKIPKEKKLNELINLNKRGINYVYLFPDDTLSMKIQALFLKMKAREIEKNELDFLTKNDSIKQQIIFLFQNKKEDYIKHEKNFYFISKEMIDYITQTHNEKNKELINDIIKQSI